ncbi:MAG: phosphopantetheinyl transferase [Planctomycetota bacterium]|jgi:phosphopantetheinyl transferase
METVVSYMSIPRLPTLRGQAGIDRLRHMSRIALFDASTRIGAPDLQVEPTALGAPRVEAGWHISKTHTEGFAAATISRSPIGIDAEWIYRPRLRAARESAGADELKLLGAGDTPDAETPVLLWTGKEAVLKQAGLGLTGISRCQLIEVTGPNQFLFELDGEHYPVRSTLIGEYWLSVSTPNNLHIVKLDAKNANTRHEAIA